MRVIFPLLLRKDGKPRKRQPDVHGAINGHNYVIQRGLAVNIPKELVECFGYSDDGANALSPPNGPDVVHECFISNREWGK